MNRFTLLFKLFLLLFTSLLFAKNDSLDLREIHVQLNWKHQFEHAGFYAAINEGYYEKIGLKIILHEKNSDSNIYGDVLALKMDFAIGYSSIVLEYLEGKPLVALASFFQHSPLIFLSKTSSNIRNVSDMREKNVMVNIDTRSAASLLIMIKKEGLSLSSMNIQEHSYDVMDLINNKTDVIAAYISNQPYILKEKNIAYNIIDPANFGYDFYENILFTSKDLIEKNPKLVKNFLKATLKGWKFALENEDEIIKLILNKYSKEKSYEALLYEAEIIKNSLMPANIAIGNIDKNRMKRIVDVYDEIGILNVNSKNIDALIYNQNKHIVLSLTQRAWIKKHPKIYFTGDPNWLPYEAFVDNKYIGIVNEHLKLIQEYTGLEIIIKESKTWNEALVMLRNKRVDILSETNASILKKEMLFTQSYLSSPIVMVMNKKASYKNSLKDIKEKKIAVVKDYGYITAIKEEYPHLNYYEVNSLQEGLLAVENDHADVFLGALPQSSYWINKLGLQNTRIVGKTKFKASLSFAVRKDYAILVDIINKALLQIDESKQQEILEQWTKAKFKENSDYSIFIYALVISFLVIVFLIIRQILLKKYSKELEYISQTDSLTKIYNRVKLNSIMAEQLNIFNRHKHSFGIILLDIDYFKRVNDSFGHDIGDSVLVEFSALLKNNIREVDSVGRWGGEEFIIVCPFSNKEGISLCAQKLKKIIEEHDFFKVGKKTASIGISLCEKDSTIKSLIKCADIALYDAKASGRNTIAFFK